MKNETMKMKTVEALKLNSSLRKNQDKFKP